MTLRKHGATLWTSGHETGDKTVCISVYNDNTSVPNHETIKRWYSAFLENPKHHHQGKGDIDHRTIFETGRLDSSSDGQRPSSGVRIGPPSRSFFSQCMEKHGTSSVPPTRTGELVMIWFTNHLKQLQEELENIKKTPNRKTPLSWIVELLILEDEVVLLMHIPTHR